MGTEGATWLQIGTPPDPASPEGGEGGGVAAGWHAEGRGEAVMGREGEGGTAGEEEWAELERRIRRGEEAEKEAAELRRANVDLSVALEAAKVSP